MATYLTRKNAIIYSHFQKYLLIHREISYKMATYRNRECVIIYENWYICIDLLLERDNFLKQKFEDVYFSTTQFI